MESQKNYTKSRTRNWEASDPLVCISLALLDQKRKSGLATPDYVFGIRYYFTPQKPMNATKTFIRNIPVHPLLDFVCQTLQFLECSSTV